MHVANLTCKRRNFIKLIWEGIACSDMKGTKCDQKVLEGVGRKIKFLFFLNDSSKDPEVVDVTNGHCNDNSCFLQ